MNKTVNINLGGMFFHIDENAYIKLSRYFEAIKKQLSDSDGKEEIMSDIEIRISELFSEKLKSDKQVISMRDLDEVIAVMGEPQDYRLEDKEPAAKTFGNTSQTKKLYRDIDKNVLGGVCRGFSYYLGIDVIWTRIIMILLAFLTQGVGIFIYIILWIVIPKATTISEKLEMKGEAVNISNIEKKVREKFENLSQKVNNIDYEKYKNRAQVEAKNFGNRVGDFFSDFFNVIGKIIGFFIIVISVCALASLLITLFTLGTTSFFSFPWSGVSEAFNYSDIPIWILAILLFLVIGIPFFSLLILGFRILIPNSKSFGKVFRYSMLGIWIISLIVLIVVGVRQATEVAFEEKATETQYLNVHPTDTLFITLNENNRYSNSKKYTTFKLVLDDEEKESLYSNNFKLHFKRTEESQPYVVVNKNAGGNSLISAKKRAEEIRYNFSLNGNKLVFDNYFLVDLKSKFRNQSVTIEVFIPESQIFFIDGNTTNFYWYRIFIEGNSVKANHTYIFENNSYRCLDCDTQEEKEEIKIINDTILVYPEKGRLQIGNDGIIIKSEN